MSDDYRLRVFLVVANVGSLTKAAQVLGISQPGVSKNIKKLEVILGKRLFLRHGRGVAMSSFGEELYESVFPIYNRIDNIMSLMKNDSDFIGGHFKIATVHTLNSYFIAPVLKDIIKKNPSLKLNISERSSMDVSELVERKQADIGLAYDTMVTGDNLSVTALHLENMKIYYSPILKVQFDHNQSVIVDEDLPLVGMPVGYALRQMLNLKFTKKLNHIIQVETVDLMLEIVRTGVAACILPSNLPERLIEDAGLLRSEIMNKTLQRKVVLITHIDNIELPAIKYMISKFKYQAEGS
ncbi:LysR family transcriptional regulator [Gammaproteobacteria bacterium AS21]